MCDVVSGDNVTESHMKCYLLAHLIPFRDHEMPNTELSGQSNRVPGLCGLKGKILTACSAHQAINRL